ncbi:heterokaryon incompatibility protein-domain-containing protein, partial [Sordaria brevicollis]
MDYTGPDTIAQIASWLRKCLDYHPKCSMMLSSKRLSRSPLNPSRYRSKLPTRILAVGVTGSSHVKLVETTTEPPGTPYVALSHCWGPPGKQPLTTTLDTLNEYVSSGISFARLPRTFADAVHITRELGIRYLWIDCLCIIQDSLSDWEAESECMGSIYEGAELTLGAAYARDSSEGLF